MSTDLHLFVHDYQENKHSCQVVLADKLDDLHICIIIVQ